MIWNNFWLVMNNTWSQALLIYCVAFLTLQIIKWLILNQINKVVTRTSFTWDDAALRAIQQIGWPFYWTIPLFVTSYLIDLPANSMPFVHALTIVVGTFYAVKVLQIFVVKAIQQYVAHQQGDESENQQTVGTFLEMMAKAMLWVIATVLVLQNLGYNVTALLGGLGVAGIAVGFALQNVLGDIFAFFSLYFDQPFKIGDFIIVGKDMGTVQKIGIKTTRIKTLSGQELIISNTQLTENRVQNFKPMEKRRIEFNFGIRYETPLAKVKQVNQIVVDIFAEIDQAELSRVHLKNLGDSALVFEVVYIVQQSDYTLYMDIQQQVNLELMERFAKAKIEFAYPTQLVHVTKD